MIESVLVLPARELAIVVDYMRDKVPCARRRWFLSSVARRIDLGNPDIADTRRRYPGDDDAPVGFDRAEHLAKVVVHLVKREAPRFMADPQAWIKKRQELGVALS